MQIVVQLTLALKLLHNPWQDLLHPQLIARCTRKPIHLQTFPNPNLSEKELQGEKIMSVPIYIQLEVLFYKHVVPKLLLLEECFLKI